MHALAPSVCEALLAFAARDYPACIAWLKRVRHIANRCGGTLAQCDLLQLTFAEATLRARAAQRAGEFPHRRSNGALRFGQAAASMAATAAACRA